MMQKTMDCPEARISLGVYVLGAIEPAERALVDAHLATCLAANPGLAFVHGTRVYATSLLVSLPLHLLVEKPGTALGQWLFRSRSTVAPQSDRKRD